jgi:hypothetical protein
MPEHQDSLPFDASHQPAPAAPPDLRDEIGRAWGLPLGQRVEISLRNDSLAAITGVLELAASPDFSWDARQPLQLRVRGYVFSSRAIVRWARA